MKFSRVEMTHSILLRSRDFLNRQSIIKKTVTGEVLLYIFLNKLDTKIGVVNTLDLVTDTANEFVRLPRVVDEFTRG